MSILLSLVPILVCFPPSTTEIVVEQNYNAVSRVLTQEAMGNQESRFVCDLPQKNPDHLEKRKRSGESIFSITHQDLSEFTTVGTWKKLCSQSFKENPRKSLLLPKNAKDLENNSQLCLSQKIKPKDSREVNFVPNYLRLISQQREGERRIFEIPVPEEPTPEATPTPIEKVEVVEVIADRQQYDTQRQVITAEGNITMRFSQAVLTSDRIQVNLADRIAVAEGDVVLTRGEQILQGERFEYYLVQDRGIITNARGQIDRSTLDRDFSAELPEEATITDRLLSDRLESEQPVTDVTLRDQFGVTIGNSRNSAILQGNNLARGGNIQRVRFEAEKVEFEPESWRAEKLRLTNDPFSPPELEVRADTANFQQIEPLVSKLTTTNSRLVFDNSLSVPLIKNSLVFDRRPRRPGLFSIGFDGEERGGLYIERTWGIIEQENITWTITPQYFIQRALIPTAFDFSDEEEGGIFDTATLGLKTEFNTIFSPRTNLNAQVAVTSFDLNDLEDNTRAKLATTQLIGNIADPYRASLEYNFRERLFNGSLGFQTVYSSIGAVVTSPNISLGKTGINLTYQGSIQNIDAETDVAEFLENNRDNDRTNLTRYQGAVFLGKGFLLWQGQPLPPTKEQGLRYTPIPVVPYLQLNTGVSGVSSFYSSGDGQHSLRGSIGIQGQLGNFSRPFFDYTGFNITYSVGINADESPFLFDRNVDQETLALGLTQQLYGPVRLGFQTSFNLDDGDDISTDYVLEYSRRTYNVSLRYNPVLEIGSFSFRVNDFNWRGEPEPFEKNNISPVIQGVDR